MLFKSSASDLVPRMASEEIDASSSSQTTTLGVGDTVVLVTLEVSDEGVDLGRLTSTVAGCGTWLSSVP